MHDDFADFHRSASRRLARSLELSGSGAAESADLAAEALVRAWERWDRVGRMDRPDLWVLRVAVNLRSRRWRRVGREVLVAPEAMPVAGGTDDAGDLDLRRAVAALPDRQRLVVVLRYYQDLTEPQCAEVMGVKVGTVAASLTHARRALARTLDPDVVPGRGAPDGR